MVWPNVILESEDVGCIFSLFHSMPCTRVGGKSLNVGMPLWVTCCLKCPERCEWKALRPSLVWHLSFGSGALISEYPGTYRLSCDQSAGFCTLSFPKGLPWAWDFASGTLRYVKVATPLYQQAVCCWPHSAEAQKQGAPDKGNNRSHGEASDKSHPPPLLSTARPNDVNRQSWTDIG